MWLWSSNQFKNLIQEEKDEICNGTGAAGTPKSITKLLDSLYGFGFSVPRFLYSLISLVNCDLDMPVIRLIYRPSMPLSEREHFRYL